jgi:hypothetical protein
MMISALSMFNTGHLKVQVIDCSIGTQRVVPHSKARIVGLLGKVQGQSHGLLINQLRQVVQDSRDQKDVTVLDWADIDDHKVGATKAGCSLNNA